MRMVSYLHSKRLLLKSLHRNPCVLRECFVPQFKMAYVKEHRLDDLELRGLDQGSEALYCLLHTILFCRAPGPFRPQTVHAEHFKQLSYSRVSCPSVTRKVERAVQSWRDSLVPAGPDLLKGSLVLSFFEKRTSTSLWGFVSNEEKIVWEQWTTPVLVSTTPLDYKDEEIKKIDMARSQKNADFLMRKTISDVHALVNESLEHVPSSMYEFEIFPRPPTISPKPSLRDSGTYSHAIFNPPLHKFGAIS